jgi:putative ABC transport system ATP-binding protein
VIVRAEAVGLTVPTPAGPLVVLAPVDLMAAPGRVVLVRGASGSGKSTLLRLLAGLERTGTGSVRHDDVDLAVLSDDDLDRRRGETIGVVPQDFGLLDELTAADNVGLPLRVRHTPSSERDARVAEVLDRVGLARHGAQRPPELSGGQQQRVAVARALVGRPPIVLADEPTAQLDAGTAATIAALVAAEAHERGATVVVASHDGAFDDLADDVVELRR